MKNKKVLTMLSSLGLVGVIATGGTLAYLSSQSNLVNNTFTVGKGFIPGTDDGLALKIDETDINNPGERTDHNDYIDLYPGDVMVKDPTVYLTSGSVESYVFVRVEGVDALESVKAKDNSGKDAQAFYTDGWDSSYWKKIKELDGTATTKTTGDGYYVAKAGHTIDLSSLDSDAGYVTLGTPLFKQVIMNKNLVEQPTGKLSDIDISACAVQYSEDQMDSYEDAFESAIFKATK